jgi:hypothetical protein
LSSSANARRHCRRRSRGSWSSWKGPGLDEEVFARLAPADVELVQSSLQSGPAADDVDDEWFEIEADDPETLREETEQEIRRLEAEIAASGRRQEPSSGTWRRSASSPPGRPVR